jgi:RNA polymerase sigma-70 factor (ECF subfamily)
MTTRASRQDPGVTDAYPTSASLAVPHGPSFSLTASRDSEPPEPDTAERARESSRPVAALDFRTVFESHYDYVWLSLRRLGVHDRDREDIVNEVFFRVHGRLETYDSSRPLRPWLFAFCVRCAADYRKLARHRREEDPPEHEAWSADPSPGPDERLLANERWKLVARALDTLDLAHRSVFVMHEIDQVPVPTLAEALGIPVGTAYTRLRAARQDFAAFVRRDRAKDTVR